MMFDDFLPTYGTAMPLPFTDFEPELGIPGITSESDHSLNDHDMEGLQALQPFPLPWQLKDGTDDPYLPLTPTASLALKREVTTPTKELAFAPAAGYPVPQSSTPTSGSATAQEAAAAAAAAAAATANAVVATGKKPQAAAAAAPAAFTVGRNAAAAKKSKKSRAELSRSEKRKILNQRRRDRLCEGYEKLRVLCSAPSKTNTVDTVDLAITTLGRLQAEVADLKAQLADKKRSSDTYCVGPSLKRQRLQSALTDITPASA